MIQGECHTSKSSSSSSSSSCLRIGTFAISHSRWGQISRRKAKRSRVHLRRFRHDDGLVGCAFPRPRHRKLNPQTFSPTNLAAKCRARKYTWTHKPRFAQAYLIRQVIQLLDYYFHSELWMQIRSASLLCHLGRRNFRSAVASRSDESRNIVSAIAGEIKK